MYLPLFKKPEYRSNILLERALPSKGNITAKVGDKVEPFTRLGMSKVSYEKMVIGPELSVSRKKKAGDYFYQGEKVGSIKFSKVIAPYNGYLKLESGVYVFTQEERDYWLLSGTWGEVTQVIEKQAVLIKTQNIDISFAYSTGGIMQGEFLVFPNPTDNLVAEYLENFSKNVSGKIIYVGNYLSAAVVSRAVELKVGGLIAGGTDKESIELAKKSGIFIGLFVGFGETTVPPSIFDSLKGVTNRFVFVNGSSNLFKIPIELPVSTTQGGIKGLRNFKYVKKGIQVISLQKPYFGHIGKVDRVSEHSIFVKFDENEDAVEIKIPNILAVE